MTILKLVIDNKKINEFLKKAKIKTEIEKEKQKILKKLLKINLKAYKDVKSLNVKIEKINLKIQLGTENAALTAMIIPIISTILSLVLKNKVKEPNDYKMFKIIPLYYNENLIKIEFSGIFKIKMIHIISIICILNKKRRDDKNERTSYRGSYDYSYE